MVDDGKHKDLTEQIIKAFYDVYNELGHGFLEAATCIVEEFENQILNYLRATDIEVRLLLNFGAKPEIKRKVFSNSNKKLKSA